MKSNRIAAAVLLVAANIPVMATSAPWLDEPDCTNASEAAVPFADTVAPLYLPLVAEPAQRGAAPVAPDQAPRRQLAELAVTLQDIRYRRGGRAPTTGFDCSGFVQYVYSRALGVELPNDAASQYRKGVRVARDALRAGDLVFFHIKGRRVSHVGLYLGEGRFIHAPSSGKRVRIDELGDSYWTHHFAGARRPAVLI